MIRIKPINAELSREFENDNYKQTKNAIINMLFTKEYGLLINYLSTNGQLDDQKIIKLITGDIQNMISAIKAIGTITDEGDNEGFHRLYKNFTNRKLGKVWAEKIGVTVCPYCNRSYIFTLNKLGIRPQYDHYFPKSLYPYLAISMYNLVPSCAICNGAKRDFNTFDTTEQKENFIYPFRDAHGTQIVFQTNLNSDVNTWLGNTDNFKIEIAAQSGADATLTQKEVITTKQLKLQKIYTKHKDYVQDIIRTSYIYSTAYFQSLVDSYPQIFPSVQDAENLVYMNYLDEEDWDKRVLSKLAHDIKHQYQP